MIFPTKSMICNRKSMIFTIKIHNIWLLSGAEVAIRSDLEAFISCYDYDYLRNLPIDELTGAHGSRALCCPPPLHHNVIPSYAETLLHYPLCWCSTEHFSQTVDEAVLKIQGHEMASGQKHNAQRLLHFLLKTRNFAWNMINFALKMMKFVLSFNLCWISY